MTTSVEIKNKGPRVVDVWVQCNGVQHHQDGSVVRTTVHEQLITTLGVDGVVTCNLWVGQNLILKEHKDEARDEKGD